MSMKKALLFTLMLGLAMPLAAQWTDRGNAKLVWGTPITPQLSSDDGKCLSYNFSTLKMVWKACLSSESDGVVGNEVTNATNTTLTRSGSGTAVSPYTLGLNLANDNTWTGVQSVLRANLGATDETGLALINTTPSTSSVTSQRSPMLRWEAHAWNTSGDGSDDKHEWFAQVSPNSGSSTSSYWRLLVSKNGATPFQAFFLSSSGTSAVLGVGSVSTNSVMANGYKSVLPTAMWSTTNAVAIPSLAGTSNGEVVVINTASPRSFRRALTTDTTAVVVGTDSSSWSDNNVIDTGIGGAWVWVDNAAVSIGDTLVVSTAANGAAMAGNTVTTPKLILGYATQASAGGSIETYSSHNDSTDVVTVTAPTAFAANQRVVLMGGTFGGLTEGAAYYVRSPSGATFQLSTTSGGAAIDLTSAAATGTPTFVPTYLISYWR